MKKLLLSFLAVIPAAVLQAAEIVAVAHPGENLPHDKTVIWTPLFQAAWDDLHRTLGEPVKVDPPNVLMDRLDHFEWNANSVMPRNRWKVWTGEATQELIDRANAEAARMTGEKTGPFTSAPMPQSRIALGLLDRDLIFKKPLHRSVEVPLEFHLADGTEPKVRFFGARSKASGAFGGVVRVLAYQDGIHAIQIAGDGDESAVLCVSLAGQSGLALLRCMDRRSIRLGGIQRALSVAVVGLVAADFIRQAPGSLGMAVGNRRHVGKRKSAALDGFERIHP